MPANPQMRASDDDRDRAAALLREHHAAGRLTVEEFHERLDAAYQAKTLGEIDQLMADRGWESRLTVKAHFGPVVAGHFGVASDKRYDILGKTVNVTARLEATGAALSVEGVAESVDASKVDAKGETAKERAR